MRRRILSIAVIVMMLALTAVPAFAHGHGRSKYVSYSVCATEGCTLTGIHSHNGKNYYGHYYGDGHDYHGYCNIANCTASGYHEHNGSYHFGHNAYDGHGYHYSSTGKWHH